MDEKFQINKSDSGFGNLNISLSDAVKRFSFAENKGESKKSSYFDSRFHRLYRLPLLPLKMKRHIWNVLRRSHIDHTWFSSFQPYWSDILQQRSLWDVHDLFFLRSYYRIGFQELGVPNGASLSEHVEAFQQPETIYFLLHQVYKEGFINFFELIDRIKKYIGRQPQSVMEYGCANAPITTNYFEIVSPKNRPSSFHIVDIENFAFHYAAYKFKDCQDVSIYPLSVDNDLQLGSVLESEVIFCLTVFEHLNAPFNTIRKLYECLPRNGILIFDYIKGDGKGLDTIKGVNERSEVLEFISKNFNILNGNIDHEKTMGTTIVRKK